MNSLQIKSVKCSSCGNSIWDICDNVLKCSNCGGERPYIRRQPRPNHVTRSQQRRIDKIRSYFLSTFGGEKYGLIKDEIEYLDYGGKVLIKIETGGNVYVAEGATVCIGIRGGLEVWTTSFATSKDRLLRRLS